MQLVIFVARYKSLFHNVFNCVLERLKLRHVIWSEIIALCNVSSRNIIIRIRRVRSCWRMYIYLESEVGAMKEK